MPLLHLLTLALISFIALMALMALMAGGVSRFAVGGASLRMISAAVSRDHRASRFASVNVGRGILLALCLPTALGTAGAAERAPTLTPDAGFVGPSHGNGTLRMLWGRQRPFHVDSIGTASGDGQLQLDQVVAFDGKPPVRRAWMIRTVGPLRYAGTLTDASGPVSGETDGATLRLRYRVRTLLVMHQTLVLMPDGRTIDNRGRITLLGIPVGRLHETIVRGAPAQAVPNL